MPTKEDEFEPAVVTPEGLKDIIKEIKEINEKIPKVIEKIKSASEFGDKSENSEYKAEKENKAILERRKRSLEDFTERCIVVSKDEISDKSVVLFSAYVTIKYKANNKIARYRIVSPFECDPLKVSKFKEISYKGELASKLINKPIGYSCDEFEIIDIEY